MSANILFILSGSISCYKACDAVSQLVQRGHRVRAVTTAAAQRFVGGATLEGLTGEKVATDLFAGGAALDHIALTRWAHVTIVCPATANTINRMAAGIADDLAGALLLAHDWRKPLLLAPAMNPAMWSHPATVAAIERLRGWGVRVIRVGSGRTACGEVGEGRLAEPEAIVAGVEAALTSPANRLRVLVTSGGTAEPIDGVRVITNTSTGRTGALIAGHFTQRGHDVTLLRAQGAIGSQAAGAEEVYSSFADLDATLTRLLAREDFDAVIHAAAVSDFAVEAIEIDGVAHLPGTTKLPSSRAPVIRLRPNPKLLDQLRARSRNPNIRVVGFKLTRGADAAEIRASVMALFVGGAADIVVQNDLSTRTEDGIFPADIWAAGGQIVQHCSDRAEIGPALEQLLTVTTAGEISTPAMCRPDGTSPAARA
ncbi:MAG: bifunctional phosphopantothenoylcysteine decarboxylase/phosphopantothenate--cysteine ligase CoaBC [Opitutaceae bacterium]|nr:bifunctional phosphopantothenoylcysteine decarboxylase/phosphopantothenate--cysteine ligase CoaBC [Opitutaceae bacterium]